MERRFGIRCMGWGGGGGEKRKIVATAAVVVVEIGELVLYAR